MIIQRITHMTEVMKKIIKLNEEVTAFSQTQCILSTRLHTELYTLR